MNLLESIFVLPLVTLLMLASLQGADLAGAQWAAGWAAHMAARSAAVIPLDAAETPERARSAATRLFAPFLRPLPLEHHTGLPLAARWAMRTGSIRLSIEVGFRDGTWLSLEKGRRRLQRKHEPAALRVHLWCAYPLRIPLVRPLFADPGSGAGDRILEAEAQFPLMNEAYEPDPA